MTNLLFLFPAHVITTLLVYAIIPLLEWEFD